MAFEESVEPGRSNAEKTELFDYRLAALERQYELEDGQKKQTLLKILKIVNRSYRVS